MLFAFKFNAISTARFYNSSHSTYTYGFFFLISHTCTKKTFSKSLTTSLICFRGERHEIAGKIVKNRQGPYSPTILNCTLSFILDMENSPFQKQDLVSGLSMSTVQIF